jgi:hypothetical protein
VVSELRTRSTARQQGDEALKKVRADLDERSKDDGVLKIVDVLKPAQGDAKNGSGAKAAVDGDGAPDTAEPKKADRNEPTPQMEEALRVLGDLVVLQSKTGTVAVQDTPAR